MGRQRKEVGLRANQVQAFRRNVDHVAVDIGDGIDLTARVLRRPDADAAVGPFAVVRGIERIGPVGIGLVGGVRHPPSVGAAGHDIGPAAEVSAVEKMGIKARSVRLEDEQENILDTGFGDDTDVAARSDLDRFEARTGKGNGNPGLRTDFTARGRLDFTRAASQQHGEANK